MTNNTLDQHGNSHIDIVNASTGRTFLCEDISVGEKISLINAARANSICKAPGNSFVLSQVFVFDSTYFNNYGVY